MSMNTEIYQDISTRTAGDIYIGVVGPVRAGAAIPPRRRPCRAEWT